MDEAICDLRLIAQIIPDCLDFCVNEFDFSTLISGSQSQGSF